MIGNIDIFENFLSTEECDNILNKCKEELILSEAQVANGDYKSRKSSVGWIDELNGVNNRLTNLLKTTYNISGMEVTGLGPFQFTEYKVGEYFDWHSDRSGEIYRDRFVSTVILLNDNYEGGILEIRDINDNLIPAIKKMGNLYVFDSGLRHRVTPVEVGTRYSLVNWISLVKVDSKKQNIL
jgi:predicted 2-oxoglutarate/Fe(II)-dependent dioxygenase YbiX